MTRLLIEALFDEGADKQAIVDKVLAMRAAGTLSDVWRQEPLRRYTVNRFQYTVNRLLVVTPDGDDDALRSALWNIAFLDGLKEIEASVLLDGTLLSHGFVTPKTEKAELTSDLTIAP